MYNKILKKQINQCLFYPNFSAAIYVGSPRKISYIIRRIDNICKAKRLHQKLAFVRKAEFGRVFGFANGSVLAVIIANDIPLQGKFNSIVFDSRLNTTFRETKKRLFSEKYQYKIFKFIFKRKPKFYEMDCA